MNKAIVIISFFTAFLIAAGGALGIAAIGGEPSKWQIIAAVVLGLITGAKDVRSLLKLPPVADTGDLPRIPKPSTDNYDPNKP